ncbi:CU044_5270 family protein [Dactylosporangium sp. NPDC051484]|uniref:CU044_5270 family protein n=1 Tax=Dactylosporangium sp. NPDC051484 TaxID=3154942 RepID=UPI00344E2DF4
MDLQKALDDLGARLGPSQPVLPASLHGRVFDRANASRRPLWLRSPGGRIALVAGGAAVMVAATLVLQTSRIGERGPAASAEATELLRHAAAVAGQEPGLAARPEQFVFVETKSWSPTTSGPVAGLTRSWLSVDGSRDNLIWKEQADPDGQHEMTLPGCRNGRAAQWGPGGTLDRTRTRPCTPDPGYRDQLPTSPEAMLAYLRRSAGSDDPGQVFGQVVTLLGRGYVPPKSRAALFTAVTALPGVTIAQDRVDAAGRRGVAVTRTQDELRQELLFDPGTYRFLGTQLNSDDDRVSMLMLRPTALLRTAIVDQVGQLPS